MECDRTSDQQDRQSATSPIIAKDPANTHIHSHSVIFTVGHGTKGRGLFATADIPPRTLIHIAPCINVLQSEYDQHMRHTVLEHYLFNDVTTGNKLLALGYGSLFNHSNRPNVNYRIRSSNQCIEYTSGHQMILAGNELCISYGSNLWFDDADVLSSSTTATSQALPADASDSSDDEENGTFPSFLGRMQLVHDEDGTI
jgi:uncharacterized protein